jgi:hypothetical protein
MKCREFVFLQSSGQLAEPGTAATTRARARMHRWMCSACRAFAANDRALDGLLDGWRDRLQQPGPPPGREGPDGA